MIIAKILVIYLLSVVSLIVLIYILSRVQMRGWLDEINKHFKNFNPKLYERKEE
jgi:hypothetical protein